MGAALRALLSGPLPTGFLLPSGSADIDGADTTPACAVRISGKVDQGLFIVATTWDRFAGSVTNGLAWSWASAQS